MTKSNKTYIVRCPHCNHRVFDADYADVEIKFNVVEYYKMEIVINNIIQKINPDLAKCGTDALDNKPVFVYGDMEEYCDVWQGKLGSDLAI